MHYKNKSTLREKL